MRARRPTAPPTRPRPCRIPPSSCRRTRLTAMTRMRPANTVPQYPPGEPPQPPPPEGPKSPRWLWIVAAVAVLAVVGLVIALVIVNSSRQQTRRRPAAVADRAELHHADTPTTTSRTTTIPVAPAADADRPRRPPSPTAPGATETVVYDVDRRRPGHQHHLRRHRRRAADRVQRDAAVEQGSRAAQPAKDSASVSIINVGREVTCSITIDGVAVRAAAPARA